MVFSGKNASTSEKRHAKVLIFKKEQTFSYFFFKKLKLGLLKFFPLRKLPYNSFVVSKEIVVSDMAKYWKSVKINILSGYITLVLIGSITVWIIYNETIKLSDNQVDINPVSEKFLIVNSILTNLYEAEGLERSYLLTGNHQHFRKYNVLMDSISYQVKSFGKNATNPLQKNHTDSIQILLMKKRQNLEEMISTKNAGSSEKLYERAMVRLAANQDSINQLLNIYKNITKSKDSIVVKQTRKKFLDRLVNVFLPQENADSTLKIVFNESMQIDSIIDVFNPADSVTQLLTTVIEEIKEESKVFEKQLLKKEQDILENDQTITIQIRQMLARLENEELLNSLMKVEQQQSHIQNITTKVILLGAIALIIVIVFLILILKDITKSQLYRKNLEQEKAYSETLLKSKEQLMMSITHDLKSPLSSIMGFSRLISNEDFTGRQKNYLKNIEQSAEYILRLINDLLDFARLESGKLKVEKIRFNLISTLEEVISGFYPLAQSKNLLLEFDIKNLPNTDYLSDPIRIKQVLHNLISNAIKFTEKGKVSISCSVTKTKEQTDFIKIEVSDTGIGISPENTEHIFEEFSRGSLAGNSKYEGTGLGLAISKRIVELLDGQIQVESNYKKGSRFTVIFPLLHQPAKFTKEKQTAENGIPATRYQNFSFKNEQILLVDDDPVLLGMTAEVLSTEGFHGKA
jgi:signal transduction histidine kinase